MNHIVVVRSLLKGATRDMISLGWAVFFPIALIVGMRLGLGDALDARRLLAGTVAFSTIFFSVHGTAFDILAQRARGVYKLLRASPYPVAMFVVWLSLARGLVAVVAAGSVAVFGNWWLGAGLSGASLLFLGASAGLGTLVFTALGIVMGNLGDNEGQVSAWNNLVTFPLLFLTETFYSLANAPAWLQLLRDVLPFNHFLHVTLAMALGEPVDAVWVSALIVLGYGGVFLVLAILTFRWDPAQPLLRLRRAG